MIEARAIVPGRARITCLQIVTINRNQHFMKNLLSPFVQLINVIPITCDNYQISE